MVRSINEIGHLTGKKTIAEYAANQEIITMLKGMGVDYAQGYGIAEPKRVLMTAMAVNG
jgi:EAL domain-containing protein (putative c-di-GMP-specific phosphodiesterase class I)